MFSREVIDRLLRLRKWRTTPTSSNVRKMMYQDETEILTIQFNDKSIYTYFNVKFDDFWSISDGNTICKTEGRDKYGSWFVGKTPSVGAAVHKYLIDRGVSYQKGGTLR